MVVVLKSMVSTAYNLIVFFYVAKISEFQILFVCGPIHLNLRGPVIYCIYHFP